MSKTSRLESHRLSKGTEVAPGIQLAGVKTDIEAVCEASIFGKNQRAWK
jgi:hypothetical protein